MLDFTKVQINIHEFNPYFPIFHNHEEAYKNQELLHYLESRIFIHVRTQKSKAFFFFLQIYMLNETWLHVFQKMNFFMTKKHKANLKDKKIESL